VVHLFTPFKFILGASSDCTGKGWVKLQKGKRTDNGKWGAMENGQWTMENGRKTETGKLKTENGKRKTEDGGKLEGSF
jgi:hypothetical protein